jgi:phage gp36-like protein
MAYCAYADIKKNLPEETLVQLTDDEGVGTVNQVRISEAIAQADAEINSYLGTKYTVPFTAPIPDIVKQLSIKMSIYHLYSRRMEEIPKTRVDRYNNSLRILEKIAAGSISIGAATEPEGESDQIKASTSAEDRVFTRGKKSDGSSGSLDDY